MIISFESDELKQCCCSAGVAEEKYGAHAQSLLALIADAEAFSNPLELLDFYGLSGNLNAGDSLSLPIGSKYIANFVAAGTKFQRDEKGGTVWKTVRRLKLTGISEIP